MSIRRPEKPIKQRPCVFLIMPLTPRSADRNHALEFLANCRKGFEVATALICRGFAVYCPAMDMHLWLSGVEVPTAEDIYEQDLSLLARMDAAFLLPGWLRSQNCAREVELAHKLHIPCFITVEALQNWKKEWEK